MNGEEIAPEKFIELLKDEKEYEVSIDPIMLLNDTQLNELKANIGKEKYEEGKVAGSEMTAKEFKRIFGVEKEGKSPETVAKYIQDKILNDAKIEPEKKVKELSESLESLQKKYETDLGQYKQTVEGLSKTIQQKEIDFYIQSNIPQLNGIKPNHAMLIYKAERQFHKDENGNLNILVGGKLLKDNMEKPVDFVTDFTTFAKQNNWLGEPGRGGGNSYGGGSEFKTIQDVMKYMEKQKIDPTSSEGLEIIKKFEQSQK